MSPREGRASSRSGGLGAEVVALQTMFLRSSSMSSSALAHYLRAQTERLAEGLEPSSTSICLVGEEAKLLYGNPKAAAFANVFEPVGPGRQAATSAEAPAKAGSGDDQSSRTVSTMRGIDYAWLPGSGCPRTGHNERGKSRVAPLAGYAGKISSSPSWPAGRPAQVGGNAAGDGAKAVAAGAVLVEERSRRCRSASLLPR